MERHTDQISDARNIKEDQISNNLFKDYKTTNDDSRRWRSNKSQNNRESSFQSMKMLSGRRRDMKTCRTATQDQDLKGERRAKEKIKNQRRNNGVKINQALRRFKEQSNGEARDKEQQDNKNQEFCSES